MQVNRVEFWLRAIAIVVAAFGFAAVGQQVALAAPQAQAAFSVTATPSTGLTEGAVITVAVSGFGAGEAVYAGQCAEPSAGVKVCSQDVLPLTTDASGSGSGPLTAHRTFTAITWDGRPWGTVDCASVAGGCHISAGSSATRNAVTPISFR
ncbi:MAG TPA: enediyne antibiotic chromoprotein [Actinophytocola sp.]|uniref:enediyne antibiotic chromoprotein n=1 Tax=Actinophytocola sp. TaxID=1872138 RepID=UPI002DDD7097|nr:enediyne antibiotic chromoprotein [Actinophytocola sp.]HEV2780559.1 enediyne antibiotic chromoprotein [Actinophytocola sp.]